MDEISIGSVCDGSPPLSSKFPWLVAQNLQDDEEQNTQDLFFYTIHNALPHYRCRIPELLGLRIRGCFHGWVILSNHPNNNKWSLWNQKTSAIIRLPTLVLEDGGYESIGECCLSTPPTDPSSILLLTRTNKPTFVFFRLVGRRNKFKWIEMSYTYQLKRLTCDGKLVNNLTCCNGKVYALNTDGTISRVVIHVDIVVKDKDVVIKLMLFGMGPYSGEFYPGEWSVDFLKGSSTELYYIRVYYQVGNKNTPTDVFLFKSDLTRINWEERECLKYWNLADIDFKDVPEDDLKGLYKSQEEWEEIHDLKEAIFFLDLSRRHSVCYKHVIASDFGGFIHIRGGMGESIYSYHVKNDTISLFSIPPPMLPTSHLSMWECRLEDDYAEAKCVSGSKVEIENNDKVLLRSGMDGGVEFNESELLNIPFCILETIIEHCVGVEYMNFRAACKQCHLAAPLIKWSHKKSMMRLQWYSFVSPWLMVVDKKRGGMITFTDPVSGDNYFMKSPYVPNEDGELVPIVDGRIHCSRFGWLLLESEAACCLVFYNPFTDDIRGNLPDEHPKLKSFCFSAPPTSLDCMIVGFSTRRNWRVDILFVNKESNWRTLDLGPDPHTICFSTFYGGDLYTLCKGGELIVFNNLGEVDYSSKVVEAEAPKGGRKSHARYFLTNCDQHLLLVSVGEYGDNVEVFKRTESKQEWEKIDSVGKYMILLCGATCLCTEAKVPFMENKIFFPRLHTKNRKVVFYSLDTCKYYTHDGESVQEHLGDLFGTTYTAPRNACSAWIEPTWSCLTS